MGRALDRSRPIPRGGESRAQAVAACTKLKMSGLTSMSELITQEETDRSVVPGVPGGLVMLHENFDYADEADQTISAAMRLCRSTRWSHRSGIVSVRLQCATAARSHSSPAALRRASFQLSESSSHFS